MATITFLNKYTATFRSFYEEDGKLTTWEADVIFNDQKIVFSFSDTANKNDEPDWEVLRGFFEFFFKHFENIFTKSRNLLIAFLKEFGTYDDFISRDKGKMDLEYVEIRNLWNNHFSLHFLLESDIYYTYKIDFYELSNLLVLIGIHRIGNETSD